VRIVRHQGKANGVARGEDKRRGTGTLGLFSSAAGEIGKQNLKKKSPLRGDQRPANEKSRRHFQGWGLPRPKKAGNFGKGRIAKTYKWARL